MNIEADHFAYRAQVCQRKFFYLQRDIRRFIASKFLDILAGYGYRPGNSFWAYIAVLLLFACGYILLGQNQGLRNPFDAFIFSMLSFHGRGFFPNLNLNLKLHDGVTILAAIEAFVGLIIEATFIATLTQRLFGK